MKVQFCPANTRMSFTGTGGEFALFCVCERTSTSRRPCRCGLSASPTISGISFSLMAATSASAEKFDKQRLPTILSLSPGVSERNRRPNAKTIETMKLDQKCKNNANRVNGIRSQFCFSFVNISDRVHTIIRYASANTHTHAQNPARIIRWTRSTRVCRPLCTYAIPRSANYTFSAWHLALCAAFFCFTQIRVDLRSVRYSHGPSIVIGGGVQE